MTVLSKWGKALAIRIPAVLVDQAKLYPGLEMKIRLLDDGSLVVRPAGAAAQQRAAAANQGSQGQAEPVPSQTMKW